jgi:aspartate-semialdehyde dehydrogenase
MPDEPLGYSIGVTGPTTLVGRELLKMLPESGLPVWKMRFLGGEASRGQLSEYNGEPQLVDVLSEDSLEFLDAVLFCGSPELVLPAVPLLRKLGVLAIDVRSLSESEGPFRTAAAAVHPSFPKDALFYRNPHPAALLIVEVLSGLLPAFSFRRAHALVTVPASSRGEEGLEELYQQTICLLNMSDVPTAVFGRQIAFNIVPFAGKESQERERMIAREIKAVLPDAPPFGSITLVATSLFHSLSILLVLESTRKLNREKLARTLGDVEGFELSSPEEAVASIDIGERHDVMLSILPVEDEKSCRLWIVCDEVRRGLCHNALGLLGGYFRENKSRLQ